MSNGGLRTWCNNTGISDALPWYRGTEGAAVQESGDRAQESDLLGLDPWLQQVLAVRTWES